MTRIHGVLSMVVAAGFVNRQGTRGCELTCWFGVVYGSPRARVITRPARMDAKISPTVFTIGTHAAALLDMTSGCGGGWDVCSVVV